MKYQVTKVSPINIVDKIEVSKYHNVIIPIDQCNLEKIVKGEIKFDFLREDLQQRLLKEIKVQDFKAKCGSSLWTGDLGDEYKAMFTLYGIGDCKCEKSCQKQQFLAKVEKIGSKLFSSCIKENVVIVSDFITTPGEYTHSKIASMLALGFLQAAYRFDRYMTTEKNKEKAPKFKELSLFTTNAKHLEEEVKNVENILHALYFVRDLVNEPGNVIYPESYANIIKENLHGIENLNIKIMGVSELEKIGMNLLLGVGQGSVKDSRVVVLEYRGDSTKQEFDIAFVGKGVTFDTGGISIKPASGMEDMKGDMAGSAAVVGTLKLLGTRKAKVNALGVVGLVENMPDGNAQRPGDIVTSLSGQTVEVVNTDAEGRLVLGDILYYTATTYQPKYMIDLATLTGAIVIALGSDYAGMYSNCDDLADMLKISSKKTGEKIWRMPLDDCYDKRIDSSWADMRNSTNSREAGSVTAAHFLKRFIDKTEHWAHLDIAGTSDANEHSTIAQKSHSTAFGVKLLNQFVIDNIEKK